MIRYPELRSAAGRYGIRQALHFTRSSSAKAKSLFAAVCAPDIQQRREARHIGQHCAGFTVLKPLFQRTQRAGVKYRTGPSHAVASKYLLAALAQLGLVLLQALLNRSIIAQLLSAKALRISTAGLLLLWRAHVTLCKR
jgi:hypothetical protein